MQPYNFRNQIKAIKWTRPQWLWPPAHLQSLYLHREKTIDNQCILYSAHTKFTRLCICTNIKVLPRACFWWLKNGIFAQMKFGFTTAEFCLEIQSAGQREHSVLKCNLVGRSRRGSSGGREKSAINTTHPPLLWSTFLKTRKTHVPLFWWVILQRGAKLSV